MTTCARSALLALTALLLGAVPASAAELVDSPAPAAGTTSSSCITAPLGGKGVAKRDFTVPATGYLNARLKGGSGDWDLAIFKRDGRAFVAGGASRGADEVAGGYGFLGERMTVQACRRAGASGTPRLSVELTPIDTSKAAETTSLVNVHANTREERNKLNTLGLDVTEHGTKDTVGVLLEGKDDVAKLRKAGFTYDVAIADLAAQNRRDRLADRRFAGRAQASRLPSGRTSYRHLADYSAELKQLAADNPGLVKPIVLPNKTYEGRSVEGIEITTNPNARDGKPIFLQMGVHHAREWPAGENAMESAYELINGYKAGDARIKPLVEKNRVIVIPIVNPDGFNASREAGELQGGGGGRGAPNPGQDDETVNIVSHPGEYRRKNCRFPDDSEGGSCAQQAFGLASGGVDPNRNYGGFWGGGGASTDPTNETYRGPAPFSEPETKNIRELVSQRQVMTLITNHTFSNLVLRPPGIQSQGEAPDEPIYKALGESMTNENGYTNQLSYQLYDTTGTTEDWSYYATGGLGFTFEIGCTSKAEDGECLTGHFHPPFAEMVKEYEGETQFSDANGRDGKGNREAYLKALENTADTSKHAVITGDAPGNAILRLTKEFDTPTSQQNEDGSPKTFHDKLDSTTRVPGDGKFEWHINQSTRPLVIKDRGRAPTGPPSAPQSFTGSPTGPPGDGAAPGGDAATTNPLNYNEHPFTAPTDGDNALATIRIEWQTPGSDWDMRVYRDVDDSGTVSAGDTVVGSSEQGTTDFEQVALAEPVLEKGKKYVIRVVNFAAVEPYDGTITFKGPDFQQAQMESWKLTCESSEGQVFTTQQLFINRGEKKAVDLSGCGRGASGTGGKDKREKPKVTSRMSLKSKGSFYYATVKGGLANTKDVGNALPAGSTAQRCAGTVKVAIKSGKRTLGVKSPKTTTKCKYTTRVKFRKSRVSRKERRKRVLTLRSVARYNGSKFLLPARKVGSARLKRK